MSGAERAEVLTKMADMADGIKQQAEHMSVSEALRFAAEVFDSTRRAEEVHARMLYTAIASPIAGVGARRLRGAGGVGGG